MYEFTDINELSNIIFKVQLPNIVNGIWKKHAAYFFIELVKICVYVEDMLLDERLIDTSKRLIHCNLKNKLNSDSNITYIPLLLDSVENEFKYLFNPINKDLKYKVTCEIKINKTPKEILLYDKINKDEKTVVDGEILIEEIKKDCLNSC